MADEGITMEVAGLAELMAKLDDLSVKGAERASRKAVRAGAVIVQAAIAERAPVKGLPPLDSHGGSLPEGALQNDIVVKVRRQKDGIITATVGPDTLTSHVARWVEYGHRRVTGGYSRLDKTTGTTRGPGKQVGDVAEHPFIRPAWEAVAQEVTDVVKSTLATEIENEARKGK